MGKKGYVINEGIIKTAREDDGRDYEDKGDEGKLAAKTMEMQEMTKDQETDGRRNPNTYWRTRTRKEETINERDTREKKEGGKN